MALWRGMTSISNTPSEIQLALPLNKKVILVKRFDRVVSETSVYRRHMISAMTLLNLDEYEVRRGYSSYLDLADLLRKYARNFGADEIMREMVEVVEGNWRQVFADAGVPDGHIDFLSTSTIASESVFYELE